MSPNPSSLRILISLVENFKSEFIDAIEPVDIFLSNRLLLECPEPASKSPKDPALEPGSDRKSFIWRSETPLSRKLSSFVDSDPSDREGSEPSKLVHDSLLVWPDPDPDPEPVADPDLDPPLFLLLLLYFLELALSPLFIGSLTCAVVSGYE